MRVLLISLIDLLKHSSPSLGIGYVSSYLQAHGHDTKVVELGSLQSTGLDDIVQPHQPDVVGISVWCCGFSKAIRCAQYFAKHFPEIIRIAGGPLASFIPDELLAKDYFDYVVAGPGEIAAAQLLMELETRQPFPGRSIKGVFAKGYHKRYEFGEEVADIDELPFPDRDTQSVFRAPNVLMMNRGCNHQCIFCVNPLLSGLKIRSVAKVVDEIRWLRRTASPEAPIIFSDDNIAIVRRQVRELCQCMKRLGISWYAKIRADVDIELVEIMKDAGCYGIGMGVESGNEIVLKNIRKEISLEQVERVVKCVSSLDMTFTLYYMLGHYCDTTSTMQDTIEHAKRMSEQYGVDTQIMCNTLFPGSPQYVHRDRLGLTIHAKKWDDYDITKPSVSGRGFTLQELRDKLYQASEQIQSSLAEKVAVYNAACDSDHR